MTAPVAERPKEAARTDVYGEMMRDLLRDGWCSGGVLERDDGYIQPALPVETYFAPYAQWPAGERQALLDVKGRTLDIGCGAGRHALWLQEAGHEVVAIDCSPGAIEICRQRGVRDARLLDLADIDDRLGMFTTFLMLCTNFGLAGTRSATCQLLMRLAALATDEARLIIHSVDPHHASRAEHRAYLMRNARQGRMPGQVRQRLRYRTIATPWFDQIYAAPHEVAQLARGTGWRLEDVLTKPDPEYIGVLTRSQPP